MKHYSRLSFVRWSCVLFFILCISYQARSESPRFVFGVKPGINIQTSQFGLAVKKFEPFVGVDWIAISVNTEDTDVSGSILVPHIGSKYYLKPPSVEHTVAPYFLGDFFFSIASVQVDNLRSEEEELIEDVLQFWGLGLAFGGEYYFAESFSVGGEYGIRYLKNTVAEHTMEGAEGYDMLWKGPEKAAKSKVELDELDGPSQAQAVRQVNEEFSFAFKITYVAISVNFHF